MIFNLAFQMKCRYNEMLFKNRNYDFLDCNNILQNLHCTDFCFEILEDPGWSFYGLQKKLNPQNTALENITFTYSGTGATG